jgi:hypothetical protein
MKVFPIGTSRLHEPLGLVKRGEIAFGRMGYFHSLSQVHDLLDVLSGAKAIDVDVARYFFRKDQTENNPFDRGLWGEGLGESIGRIQEAFHGAKVLILEISSLRSYRMGSFHVQGNPNHFRNAPYSEVWKDGYYARYNPELQVENVDDDLVALWPALCERLERLNKQAVVLGHLVDRRKPNPTRLHLQRQLDAAMSATPCDRLMAYDPSPLVEQFGFRVLDDGTTDIHHLPWAALALEQEALMAQCRVMVNIGARRACALDLA